MGAVRSGPARCVSAAIEARPDQEERMVARRLEEWQRNMIATVQGIKAAGERWWWPPEPSPLASPTVRSGQGQRRVQGDAGRPWPPRR